MCKIKVLCPACNKNYEITIGTFKRKKTNFCRDCYSINTQKGIKRPQFSREKSKRWKGGEYISSDGYEMVKIEGVFCESGRQVYKRKHVLIYENFLGRELVTEKGGKNGEQIHHIDGDKQNNNLDNLLLCSNSKEHRLVHASLERVAFELIRKGVIKFDKQSKTYIL